MKKITIEKCFIRAENKQGVPFRTKQTNKPFKMISLLTTEFKPKYISAMIWDGNSPLNLVQEGQTLEVIVTENGEYLNFELPKKEDLLEQRIKALEDAVFTKKSFGKVNNDEQYLVPDKVPDISEF